MMVQIPVRLAVSTYVIAQSWKSASRQESQDQVPVSFLQCRRKCSLSSMAGILALIKLIIKSDYALGDLGKIVVFLVGVTSLS